MSGDFLIFPRSPPPLCEKGIQCSTFSIRTDLPFSGLKELPILRTRKMAPLVARANGRRGLSQGAFECSQDKRAFQRLIQFPGFPQSESPNPGWPLDTSGPLSSGWRGYPAPTYDGDTGWSSGAKEKARCLRSRVCLLTCGPGQMPAMPIARLCRRIALRLTPGPSNGH